ncbi:hypothetical protein BD770DRAFT_474388 [Pilaira anomala]|nr:hypothetical protein BD770DRAFT_474388 [Pilaira anomala]
MRPDMLIEPVARYVSLHGDYIDWLGDQPHDLVTKELIENQQKRDKGGYHVTVINHLEIEKLRPTPADCKTNKATKKHLQSSLRDIVGIILDRFGSPSRWEKPVDLGMGISRENDAVSYFRVLYWPLGQYMRHYVGLNQANFHVTVGFAPRDVHTYKGPATLICLKEGQACSSRQMDLLVKYAYFYHRDCEFIQELYKTCWRHGYYGHAFALTRNLIKSILVSLYHKIFKSKQSSFTETAPVPNSQKEE